MAFLGGDSVRAISQALVRAGLAARDPLFVGIAAVVKAAIPRQSNDLAQTLVDLDHLDGFETAHSLREWLENAHLHANEVAHPTLRGLLRNALDKLPPDVAPAPYVLPVVREPMPSTRHARWLPGDKAPECPDWVDRPAASRQLDHALETGLRLVAVCGLGGAGKTSLVARWLQGLTERAEVVWYSFYAQRSLFVETGRASGLFEDTLRELALAVTGREASSLVERGDALRLALLEGLAARSRERPVLLALDGIELFQREDGELAVPDARLFISNLVYGSYLQPGSMLVTTSRLALPLARTARARELYLRDLEPGQAAALARSIGVPAAQVPATLRRVGRLPLAVSLGARYVALQGSVEDLRIVEDDPDQPRQIALAKLHAVLDGHARLLQGAPVARACLALLSHVDAYYGARELRDTLVALVPWGTLSEPPTPAAVSAALDLLERHCLVEREGERVACVHAHVRDAFRASVEPAEQDRAQRLLASLSKDHAVASPIDFLDGPATRFVVRGFRPHVACALRAQLAEGYRLAGLPDGARNLACDAQREALSGLAPATATTWTAVEAITRAHMTLRALGAGDDSALLEASERLLATDDALDGGRDASIDLLHRTVQVIAALCGTIGAGGHLTRWLARLESLPPHRRMAHLSRDCATPTTGISETLASRLARHGHGGRVRAMINGLLDAWLAGTLDRSEAQYAGEALRALDGALSLDRARAAVARLERRRDAKELDEFDVPILELALAAFPDPLDESRRLVERLEGDQRHFPAGVVRVAALNIVPPGDGARRFLAECVDRALALPHASRERGLERMRVLKCHVLAACHLAPEELPGILQTLLGEVERADDYVANELLYACAEAIPVVLDPVPLIRRMWDILRSRLERKQLPSRRGHAPTWLLFEAGGALARSLGERGDVEDGRSIIDAIVGLARTAAARNRDNNTTYFYGQALVVCGQAMARLASADDASAILRDAVTILDRCSGLDRIDLSVHLVPALDALPTTHRFVLTTALLEAQRQGGEANERWIARELMPAVMRLVRRTTSD